MTQLISQYIPSNGKLNGWKDVVSFEAMARHFPGSTEKVARNLSELGQCRRLDLNQASPEYNQGLWLWPNSSDSRTSVQTFSSFTLWMPAKNAFSLQGDWNIKIQRTVCKQECRKQTLDDYLPHNTLHLIFGEDLKKPQKLGPPKFYSSRNIWIMKPTEEVGSIQHRKDRSQIRSLKIWKTATGKRKRRWVHNIKIYLKLAKRASHALLVRLRKAQN